jgi:hypothetical protein
VVLASRRMDDPAISALIQCWVVSVASMSECA